jgi:hypothetical protein
MPETHRWYGTTSFVRSGWSLLHLNLAVAHGIGVTTRVHFGKTASF